MEAKSKGSKCYYRDLNRNTRQCLVQYQDLKAQIEVCLSRYFEKVFFNKFFVFKSFCKVYTTNIKLPATE